MDIYHLIYRAIIFVFICGIASIASADKETVLYLYGDVSAKGAVPSGDAPPFHQMRLNDTGSKGLSEFNEALLAAGFDVKEQYDQTIRLSAKSLAKVDVLILASNQRMFDAEEAVAVKKWVEKGGGLVAWSDSAFGGDYREVGIDNTTGRDSDNIITEQFGMHFLTDCGGGNYLIRQYTEDHFLNRNQKDEGLRFRGEGVSYVRVSPPARILANAQRGGLGTKPLKVNEVDGVFNPETDAALAIAEIGKGRVVGIFDRNLFWNAGSGTRLSHSDNREFTQRVMLWAAGVDDEKRIPKDLKTKSTAPNEPPKITISHVMSDDGEKVYFTAEITDEDDDGIYPEIKWIQTAGPEGVVFENDNPNTLTPMMMLPKKGMYQFEARVIDGEYTLRQKVKIKREK